MKRGGREGRGKRKWPECYRVYEGRREGEEEGRSGRGKRKEGRGKREEGRGKREEGRGKREEGRGQREEEYEGGWTNLFSQAQASA
jgi:hypothetical protein